MRVVDAIAEWFEVAGFKHYFGYAGGSIWPFLDALTDKPKIEGIQAKHESHAVHMADMYYRVTGKIAPVIVKKGPGLLNAVGAAPAPCTNSAPVLIIAGGSAPPISWARPACRRFSITGSRTRMSIFRPVMQGHAG